MEALFIHLANEAYKKRIDVEIKFIPVYAERMFTRYTYIHEKGFECSVNNFIALYYIYISKYIKLIMIFYNIYSFTNLSMEDLNIAVNLYCNNGHGYCVMNFVNR